MGFGYRAKYIAQTARYIDSHEKGEEWLVGLRSVPYSEAKEALVSLSGVGPKVADCVVRGLKKCIVVPMQSFC